MMQAQEGGQAVGRDDLSNCWDTPAPWMSYCCDCTAVTGSVHRPEHSVMSHSFSHEKTLV